MAYLTNADFYQTLKARTKKRQTKPFGWRLHSHWCWLMKDEKTDDFLIYQRYAKYERTPGGTYKRNPNKLTWMQQPFLIVPKEGPIRFRWTHRDPSIKSYMRQKTGMWMHRPRTKSQLGDIMGFWLAHNNGWTKGPTTFATGWTEIDLETRTIRSLEPVKVRRLNNSKRKALNRLIADVRFRLKARAKMGAFAELDHNKLYPSRTEYDQIDTGKETGLACLHGLRDDDIKTYYRLLRMIDTSYGRWRITSAGKRLGDASLIMHMFEKWIRARKEYLMRTAGVVEYVEI